MYIQNTLTPYTTPEYLGIQYGVCRDYSHISRYRGLRQVVHSPTDPNERFVALETPNTFTTKTDVQYYDVLAVEENRLDLIAEKFLGSAQYSWVIAYFNHIEDGFSVREGQRLKIPKSVSSLFASGEVLASVPPTMLNLGAE